MADLKIELLEQTTDAYSSMQKEGRPFSFVAVGTPDENATPVAAPAPLDLGIGVGGIGLGLD